MTDFRDLCARMADELDHYRQLLMDDRRETHALANEARAALAQPEPVVLTRPDCFDFAMDFLGGTEEAEVRNYIERLESTASAALAQPEPQGPTDEEAVALYSEVMAFHECQTLGDMAGHFSRAVLTRWGRPAIEPVPVAERLPGPEDCDTEGECWWWHPDHKEDEFSDGWMLLKPKWADGHHDADDSPVHTHWLPHHALPVPQQEVQ